MIHTLLQNKVFYRYPPNDSVFQFLSRITFCVAHNSAELITEYTNTERFVVYCGRSCVNRVSPVVASGTRPVGNIVCSIITSKLRGIISPRDLLLPYLYYCCRKRVYGAIRYKT